jgi:membrane-bound lytic murein transglycosylase D
MLFNYQQSSLRKIFIVTMSALSFCATTSLAYGLTAGATYKLLTASEVTAIIEKSNLNKTFHIQATPEVVNELNSICNSSKARSELRAGLVRMKQYQGLIEAELAKSNMHKELLVVPLVESDYQPLDESSSPVKAAGIWQIIPSTARHIGLTVNDERDDRMNMPLATKAAVNYLQANYEQFHDWHLAIIAYEVGEKRTAALIHNTDSKDAWVLAHSASAPKNMGAFIVRLDAELIIMLNPDLINSDI